MINGIINIYKEQGFTSFDVVAKLRGITHQKKIGHTGTLDPDAVGVLPVCFGNATKVCELMTDKSKTYETVFELGYKTDTQDLSGRIIEKSDVKVTKEQVQSAISGFVGEYDQIPPMYSAKKINGKKLYELARSGIEVERKSCRVTIHDICILEIIQDEENYVNQVRMSVSCSKGTYIRTLCNDIGDKLGCFATMSYLKRTRVGAFDLDNALTLGEIEELVKENKIDQVVLNVDQVFDTLRKVMVLEEGDRFLYNGNSLFLNYVNLIENNIGNNSPDNNSAFVNNNPDVQNVLSPDEQVRVYDYRGNFCAVYKYDNQAEQLKPVKMFL